MRKLYDFELSGHAHRVRLMLSLLQLPYEKITVDLTLGDQQRSEFRAINPFAQVPVLVDGDLVIRDSNAIITYLANRYAPSWNPQTTELQVEVQQWLAVAARKLVEGPARARLITVFGASFDQASVIKSAYALLDIIEGLLFGKTWMVGQQASIADVACYSYLAHAPEGGIDLAPYANIRAWLVRVEGLDGFVPMSASELPAMITNEEKQ